MADQEKEILEEEMEQDLSDAEELKEDTEDEFFLKIYHFVALASTFSHFYYNFILN